FVELSNPTKYTRIGNSMDESDLIWHIHIIHDYYDTGDETAMEQDLTIFDLRDKVVALLSNYKPTACSSLLRISEDQDYEHNNVYHYIIEFTYSYMDSAGSPFDPAAAVYVEKTTPTDVGEIDTTTSQ